MKAPDTYISAHKQVYKTVDRITTMAIVAFAIFVISLLLTFSATHMMREGLSFHAPVNIVLPFCLSCLSGGTLVILLFIMGILHCHARPPKTGNQLAQYSNAPGKEEKTS